MQIQKKYLIAMICIAMILMMLPSCKASAEEKGVLNNPYHILYISSYSYSWGSVPLQIEGVDKAFEGTSFVVNYEFMDTKNTDYSEGYKEFYDLLKYKMETRYPYDGIVVGDDAALNFVELYRDDLFKDIPISFLAVDNIENGEKAAADPLTTGIVEQADYQKNIEIAHKLLPEATTVTFILDNMENGIGIAKQLEKLDDVFVDYNVKYLNTSEYTREELCEKLSEFTKNDIVFFISMGQQNNGQILTENERYQMIREFGSAPMFRLTPAGVGDGAVGGYVVDFKESGYIAGEMIEQMLLHPEQTVPKMCYDTPGMYYFDYAMMDLFGLKISVLPKEATVINIPESTWRTYSNQIIIGMLFVLLTVFVIFSIGLRRAKKKIQIKNNQLQVANNAKTDFLSNMSHEIRTPMNAIIGITELSKEEVKNIPTASKYMQEIDDASHYLLGVINDILDMSRIESGKNELHMEWESIGDDMMACIDMIKPMMEKKHIYFEYPEPLEKLRKIEYKGDHQKTQQMFMNLLNNAYKFTPEGGHVRVSAKNISVDKDKMIATDQIIFEDDGCGMSDDFIQNHLFHSFEQERNENTRAIQGTGLGLALARNIARQMGGDITVKSELGKGSTFTVTYRYQYRVVALSPDVEKRSESEGLTDDNCLAGKHVLLVEDHPLNAEIAKKLLEKKKMVITVAADGEKAVSLYCNSEKNFFDAILMDLRMPNMGGIEATKMIRALEREDAKEIPIIAMTANAFEEDRNKTKAAGMDAHLSKPIEPKILYQTLAKLISMASSYAGGSL